MRKEAGGANHLIHFHQHHHLDLAKAARILNHLKNKNRKVQRKALKEENQLANHRQRELVKP